MNLADAIRQAAATTQPGTQPYAQPAVEAVASHSEPTPEPIRQETEVNPVSHSTPNPAPIPDPSLDPTLYMQEEEDVRIPEPPSVMVTSGNVVRLELFLGAEQLNAMLKAVMQGQHSVMTLREAASYLRLNASILERMATEGEIPAFSIEGRWRFPKATLDEWLAVKSYQQDEEQDNVA